MVKADYDLLGIDYNQSRKADPAIISLIIALLQPGQNQTFVDVGCGTGNYTIELANRGYNFVGIEPSAVMLDKARERSDKVTWIKGVAERMPFSDGYFDGAMATLTLHHWQDLTVGLGECYRVLREGGKLVIFTATPAQMKNYWLNHYFPKMMKGAMAQMPSPQAVASAAQQVNFKIAHEEKFFIRDPGEDLFLYSGKNNPTLYFDENIRNGISSFTFFGNHREINEGLKKLEKDLDNGNFTKVRRRYEDSIGDYLFVVLEK